MTDPRFFTVAGPFRLAELADIAGAELAPGCDPDLRCDDVAPLDSAVSGQISFLENRKYIAALAESNASACILNPDMADRAPAGMALLFSKAPYRGYALIAQAFYPARAVEPGIAAGARVDGSASLGEGSRVEHGAVVGQGVEIGARSLIGANAVIGDSVKIGDDTLIGENTTLSHCLIGSRVVICPGVRIGQRGFGFAIDPSGHVTIPQLGRVIVEDDVDIGANTTIDRGAGPDTVIGAGAKIDNLVQIAHNVRIGRRCVLAAQVGISGSVELGDMVVMAGQSGAAGHLKIGSGAQIGGQAGILRDVAPGDRLMGTPARPVQQFFREIVTLKKLSGKKEGT